ncbi:MAG: AmmeMemoRadiSam system protein A [Gemmatimonadetes bacterium]|nr:MAG: AmmeMemoRadiSam system protein A [Gemmatimonadota bacterium]
MKPTDFELTSAEKTALLRLAHGAIANHLTGEPLPVVDVTERLTLPLGAFVTLHHHGDLRGCIGFMSTNKPLYQTIPELAVSAASRDFRFPPVTVEELPQLDVEISILTPLEPIEAIEEIIIGKHGLCIEFRGRRGVLLPQVAPRYHWTAQEFVEAVCHKAGLPADAWQEADATLSIFSAYIFGDSTV